MTLEELETLTSGSQELVAILEKYNCFEGPEFNMDAIKAAITEMSGACIQNNEECAVFLQWMEEHEFYTSPASTKFHGNFKGGLAVHSLMVTYQALKLAPAIFGDWIKSKTGGKFTFTAEDIFVSCISHDFCKAGFYSTSYKNTKDVFGNWTKTPYYTVKNDVRNLGHGNESMLLLLEAMPSYIKKRPVLEAVSRHMGFSDLTDTEKMNYSNFLSNPLVLLIQLADQSASGWYDY
ncbi:MAG: hypothetical protein MJ176_05980 [Treponema sp.]|nr:hypothetical protein [Treponema sp.]